MGNNDPVVDYIMPEGRELDQFLTFLSDTWFDQN
jgi:hypothetical protein